jgi:hypothetical protein
MDIFTDQLLLQTLKDSIRVIMVLDVLIIGSMIYGGLRFLAINIGKLIVKGCKAIWRFIGKLINKQREVLLEESKVEV